MVNWMQHIIPQIKDKQGDLMARMEACLLYFKEALATRTFDDRNLAGLMFRSLNEYKYAKPFMAELAQHMVNTLSPQEVSALLEFNPELMPVVPPRKLRF